MSISLDKIEMITKRANVSYEEAVEALKRNENDLVETLIDLEQSNKLKHNTKKKKNNVNIMLKRIIEPFRMIQRYQFLIKREDETVLKLPLIIVSILIALTFPFSIIFLGLILFSEIVISIKTNDKEYSINDIVKRDEDDR